MAYRVDIHASARRDLTEIVDWYASTDDRLWRSFAAEFDALMQDLANFPHMGRPQRREWRAAHLARFPYSIWYLLDDRVVHVHRIIHHAVDPARWPN